MSSASPALGRSKTPGGSFQSLDLHPSLFRGVRQMGYRVPTPVQRRALPVALAGEDLVCMARTGSGKTAAFLIPLLQRLGQHQTCHGARALVLSPTRELAAQTERFARQMAKFTDLRLARLTGGEGLDQQFEALAAGPDVILATPGRLTQHLEEIAAFSLKSVELVVFDEADRLFEMGFAEQLHQILRSVSRSRQTLLFSATLPAQLVQFTRAGLQDPHLIRLDVEQKISDQLRLAFFTVRSGEKLAALLFLLREMIPRDDMTILFAPTRHHCELLHELLDAAGFRNAVIYGSMDQDARNQNLQRFRRGLTKLLLVTDVAARGLDVPLLNHVINYSFPPAAKLFVHRVGRAARQGRSGTAFSLVETEELPYMADLLRYLDKPPQTYTEDAELAASSAGRGYALDQMTPAMVHYGAMPQDVLDLETESVRTLFDARAPTLDNLQNVCDKAMKQYRRSRADATHGGLAAARRLTTTELHPLCRALQSPAAAANPAAAQAVADQGDLLARIQHFRPPQTVFEIGTRAKAGRVLSRQAEAMQSVRKQRKRAEFIKRTVMNGGEALADDVDAGDDAGDDDAKDPRYDTGDAEESPAVLDHDAERGAEAKVQSEGARRPSGSATARAAATAPSKPSTGRAGRDRPGAEDKVHLTGADKRRLKKERKKRGKEAETKLRNELEAAAQRRAAVPQQAGVDAAVPGRADVEGRGFRDEKYYIDYKRQGAEIDDATERALAIGAAAESSGKGTAGRMATAFEEAMQDEDPDAALKELRKRKVMHWDKRHNRYVKTTMAELAERRGKGAGKLRTESGTLVSKKRRAAEAGAIYEKWQKATNRRVAGVGEAEQSGAGIPQNIDWRNKKRGRAQFERAKKAGVVTGKAEGGRRAKSELRSAPEIAALRRKKQKVALRNMPKAKRRAVLHK